MARSLNKVQLIGNLTRDPELRYTGKGTAVATFTVATNRQWKTESGETRDDAEFHRCVAWDKLAEICSQLLGKGKKVFVEGRLQTRKWEDKDGQTRYTTEIVVSEMLLLDSSGGDYEGGSEEEDFDIPDDFDDEDEQDKKESGDKAKKSKPKTETKNDKEDKNDSEDEEEIPF